MAEENISTATEGLEAEAGASEEVKTYTAEEVQALLQSEADKRVTAALKKQQAKYEKQLSLSKLDGSEREKAEQANRIQELEEQLAAYQVEKNRSEIKSVLASRGLSAEFADLLTIGDDIEQAQANIDAFDKLFKAAVKVEVEKRLAGNAPKGNGAAPAEVTRDTAKKMSLAELAQLAEKDPDTFNKFFN